MATDTGFVRDNYGVDGFGRPIPGATVTLFTRDGLTQVAQTTTDEMGAWTLTADDAVYLREVRFGDSIERAETVFGSPPEFQGNTGLAANTFTTAAALAAAPTAQFKSATIVGIPGVADGPLVYETANAPYTLGPTTFKADVSLSVGAWVRQDAGGITAKRPSLTAAQYRTLSAKVADRFDLRDVLGFQVGTANDMSSAVQIGLTQAAADRVPLHHTTGFAPVTGLFMPDGCQFIGSGKGNSGFSKIPGATPLLSIQSGVSQHFRLFGLSFGGYGTDPTETMLKFDSPAAAPGTNGGAWYGTVEQCQIINAGGKAIWLKGGAAETNASTIYQQFLTFKDVLVLRSILNLYSRSLSMTGNVGQIYFEGACQFDSNGQGSVIADGFNVCASRQWQHTDGRVSDAADAFLESYTGWTPSADVAPYRVNLNVTSQGSKYGVMIDRGEIDVTGGYFENIEKLLTVTGSARCRFTDNILRNAAGSATSAGTGYTVHNNVSRVQYGRNNVTGYVDRSYIATSPLQHNRVGPDLTDFNMSSVASNATVQVAATGGFTLPVNGNNSILALGGGTAGPDPVNTIDTTLGGGDRITVTVNFGSMLRLLAGGNISLPGGQERIYRGGDSFVLEKLDLSLSWTVVSDARVGLYSSGAPAGAAYYHQYERIRNASPATATPIGWEVTASGAPPTVIALPNYA